MFPICLTAFTSSRLISMDNNPGVIIEVKVLQRSKFNPSSGQLNDEVVGSDLAKCQGSGLSKWPLDGLVGSGLSKSIETSYEKQTLN
ncbi:hypothetical protein GJ496_001679 [Pomphorhynchus laevis]|nr:hypothetical protein GJ496_001679 [Pomphorhynchus laevis]